jgi:predicted ArsR family transcriptional regulator
MTNKRSPRPQEAAMIAAAPPSPVVSGSANSKVALLIRLLTRAEGATLDQMVAATGWQPHTMRASLTRLKARGYMVTSEKVDGIRTYRASGPAAF